MPWWLGAIGAYQRWSNSVVLLERIRRLCDSHSKVIALLLIVMGVVERTVWLQYHTDNKNSLGEAFNVAASVARNGTVADTFGKGSGLSAHFTPVLPMLAGYLYRIFGLQSFTADTILTIFSMSCVLGTGFLLFLCLERLGTPAIWRLIALGLFCMLPLFPHLETVMFRIWEGALASLLSAWILLRMLDADRLRIFAVKPWIVTSFIAAFLFFLNPPSGLACFAMMGIWLLRQRPFRTWPGYAALSALALVLVLAPWTIRNYEAFGRFIPLRSNMGLELALANHPAAVSGKNAQVVFETRLHTIHPQTSRPAFDQMEAMGGERVYADTLGAETKQWIRNNPAAFATLSLRHLFQFYFPPQWQWELYNGVNSAMTLKLSLTWLFSALGLIGALAGLFVWRGLYLYPAALVLVTVLPYMVVQPILRYHYLIYAITLFLGIDLIRRCVEAVLPVRKQMASAIAPNRR